MNIGKKISGEFGVILDFIRGITAQIVLIGHLLSFYGWQQFYNIPIIQNFGVLVFFILSGFLIVQTTIVKGPSYGFKNYVIDRFTRIFYSFIPALLLVWLIDFYLIAFNKYESSFVNTIINFIGNIFQLQAYPFVKNLGIETFGSGRPFWTVCIEWWLYITFGFLYYWFFDKKSISKKWIFLFVISLPVFFENVLGRGNGLSVVWILGLILSLLYNYISININLKISMSLLFFCSILLVLRTLENFKMYDLGIAISFSIILFVLMNSHSLLALLYKNNTFVKFSKFLASYSYSLYLIHYSLIVLYMSFDINKSFLNFLLIFLFSNIISYIFYLSFERKHYLLKNHLKKAIN